MEAGFLPSLFPYLHFLPLPPMEPVTLFLLRFFGPIFLLIGCSLLLYGPRYETMIRELREFTLSYYFAALLAICTGLAVVLTHNRWNTLPETLVTLIGWGGVIKGTARFLVPDLTRATIARFIKPSILTIGGIIVVAWGGYMTWAGFFA